MANNVQQQQFQQPGQLQTNNPHHCKECGLYMNSAESLEVHLQYHKENLLNKWANQAAASGGAAPHPDEANNNTPGSAAPPPAGAKIKREFPGSISTSAADSSDMLKKSPEYGSRATPEINVSFGHPPTPQSYHSASSPYQTPDNSAFSPGFANSYGQVKQERASPTHFTQQLQQQNYQSFQDAQQFYTMEGYGAQQQQQEYMPKMGGQNYRYHPYQQQQQQHAGAHQVVSGSSPAYPPQPTPSPSPKQCDKCGYVCESATQLIEHLSVAHPSTPTVPHLPGNYQQNHFIFGANQEVKSEDADAQSEILDLDSHKVVHQVYPEEQDKRPDLNNGQQNPHSVSAMLTPWAQQQQALPSNQVVPTQQQQQQKMFQAEAYQTPKFQHDYMGSTPPGMMSEPTSYRSFDHMPPQAAAPIITSTQVVPNNPVVVQTPPSNPKSANWKSNEARRPKTYNCTACNKWFTSSGHLKRHYNTTLHKNAVKSSGQPDPATMPISAHHHPARESTSNREDSSRSPAEDSRSEDSMNSSYERASGMSGLLQQPPNGPYDRQPAPNILHPLHSPMGANTLPASPPNGEAGLSASATTIDSRGLLSISNTPSSATHSHHLQQHHHHLQQLPHTITTSSTSSNGFNIAVPPAGPAPHMMSSGTLATMDNQFQMYPNECAPHVTQDTAATTNSLSTTGEFLADHQQSAVEYPTPIFAINSPATGMDGEVLSQTQPLPSFAQINSRCGLLLGYNIASVGGPGPATVPFTTTTYYTIGADQQLFQQQQQPSSSSDDDYKLTTLTSPQRGDGIVGPYSPVPMGIPLAEASATTDHIKIHTIQDIQLQFASQPAIPEEAHTKRDYESFSISDVSSTTRKKPRSRKAPVTSTITSNNNDCLLANRNNVLTNQNNTAIAQISKNGLHKCIDCDKVFNKSCYLTQHNKTFHCGDKPFKCTRCGKRFFSDSQYQEHLRKHAGEKPHKCDRCPKQFNHKTDLRRHMCLHTGRKPYVCEKCLKGFIRKDHMVKHCETHKKREQNPKNNTGKNATSTSPKASTSRGV